MTRLFSLLSLAPAARIQVAAFDVLMVIGKLCVKGGVLRCSFISKRERNNKQ